VVDAPRQSPIEPQFSNFRSQISNLRRLRGSNPLDNPRMRKWLKISGGGGTQPYSATQRVRARPAIPLASA
jgi:hypothetical protein